MLYMDELVCKYINFVPNRQFFQEGNSYSFISWSVCIIWPKSEHVKIWCLHFDSCGNVDISSSSSVFDMERFPKTIWSVRRWASGENVLHSQMGCKSLSKCWRRYVPGIHSNSCLKSLCDCYLERNIKKCHHHVPEANLNFPLPNFNIEPRGSLLTLCMFAFNSLHYLRECLFLSSWWCNWLARMGTITLALDFMRKPWPLARSFN